MHSTLQALEVAHSDHHPCCRRGPVRNMGVIEFTDVSGPVDAGYVDSLWRPGGTIHLCPRISNAGRHEEAVIFGNWHRRPLPQRFHPVTKVLTPCGRGRRHRTPNPKPSCRNVLDVNLIRYPLHTSS